jgi:hypothetical protein
MFNTTTGAHYYLDPRIELGTNQHECADCGEWEECAGLGDSCTQDEAGWIRGRFYCKDCAEARY